MTPADAAKVLTLVSVYDNRQFDEATAVVWADALQGLDVDDCLDAVKAYFRRSRQWIMPVDVREEIRAVRRQAAIEENARRVQRQIEGPAVNTDPAVVAERIAVLKAAVAAVRTTS